MPRFVNLPTEDGREASVRADRVEYVIQTREAINAETGELKLGPSETRSLVTTASGQVIHVALPKSRVMELLGLHLANNREEWV